MESFKSSDYVDQSTNILDSKINPIQVMDTNKKTNQEDDFLSENERDSLIENEKSSYD